MSTETISENITGPWWADAGDTVRVLEGVLVDGTETQGIAPRSATDTGIRVVVHGTVIGEYYGVNLQGNPEGVGGNRLFISETGSVTGLAPIYAGDGSGNRVVNNGVIDGRFGIVGDGAETVIVNHGTIRAELSAFQFGGDELEIRNTGLIEAGGWGYLGDSSGSRIVNAGSVETQSGGFLASGCTDFSLLNRGDIKDHHEDGYGAQVYLSDSFLVANSGGIEAFYGVHLISSDGLLRNSGTLTGAKHGVFIDGNAGDGVVLRNSGHLIGGDEAVNAHNARLDLSNPGAISGDVTLNGDFNDQIRNSGLIDGDVALADGNDIYFARGTGHVTGDVRGGWGHDTLTGASANDRLFGEQGNDILRGRDGDDFLDGGTGNDLLTGAQGRDNLTGGAGADIFAFGADAGQDRVTDFEQGTDVIRMTGQEGGFGALVISDHFAHLKIIHDGGVILLEGLAGATLTASDFDFL